MGKFSLLTGLDKTASGYESPFKKMCLNCTFCSSGDPEPEEKKAEDASYDGVEPLYCYNKDVLEVGKKKIMDSLANQDFEVDAINVRRLALKDATKKCKQYEANMEALIKELRENFE